MGYVTGERGDAFAAVCVIIAIVGLILLGLAVDIVYINQDELAFKYNAISGKPIDEKNNPLLPVGYNATLGFNAHIFRASSQVHQYEFIAKAPTAHNETFTFDSAEGVTMETSVVVFARAMSLYKLYENFGQKQYDYPKVEGIKDSRIYQAIRDVGAFTEARLVEITQSMSARDIRANPATLKNDLLSSARRYAEQLGIGVSDVLLTGKFEYPDETKGAGGENVIKQAMERIGEANTRLRRQEEAVKNAAIAADQSVAEADREADTIRSQANREAEQVIAEVKAIADELRATVKAIGPDAATRIYVTRRLGELVKGGVIPQAVLTKDSLIGSAFYPANEGTTQKR